MSLFRKIRDGLERTRLVVADGIAQAVGRRARIEPALYDELEELLLRADVGVDATEALLRRLRERVRSAGIEESAAVPGLLRDVAAEILGGAAGGAPPSDPALPRVVLVCGVNGVGKTTTIGKLARRASGDGGKVVVVAADTFRAAACEQLAIWAERAGAELVRSKAGADPASVAFDGVSAARSRGAAWAIVDTAGRLQSKGNLMEELRKIHRVVGKAMPGAPHEVLLVLDATVGQNGLLQAREFLDASRVTGIVLAKLDGTAKGGVVLAIALETGLPVRFVGVGEGIDDLEEFDARAYASALVGIEEEEEEIG